MHFISLKFQKCYSDVDFRGCATTSEVLICFAGEAVSWWSRRQAMVATSTKAEIVAANEPIKEIIWLTGLSIGMISFKHVPILQVDAAVRLAQNSEFHRRTEHIEIKIFFIRESN